ncbi:MAG: hypothetical protein ACR2RE_00895 [Geminicoccaceae bacterium]
MYAQRRAADAAKRLLRTASHRLMTPDPTTDRAVTQGLDRSLDWSLGDAEVRPYTGRSFEPNFSEMEGRSLAFQVQPFSRGLSADDQREIANGTVRSLVQEHFGPTPLRWLDGRSEGMRSHYGTSRGMGARYALGLDQNGLREVSSSYEWGPGVLDLLPSPVMSLARIALDHLPQLRPFATTIRCSAYSGGQQISFELPFEARLDDFKPLMEALGMGERHGGFVMLMAFVLGARFKLPPDVATLTLLHTQTGPEMRLDVNIDALPDAPEQLLPLLRLPLTERPQHLAALDSWMTAMTPEGYFGPGSVTVLSVRVRPAMQARLALFLRPLALDAALPAESGVMPTPPVEPVIAPPTQQPSGAPAAERVYRPQHLH